MLHGGTAVSRRRRRSCVRCEPVDSSDIISRGRGPLVYIKMQIKNECAYLNGKDLRYN